MLEVDIAKYEKERKEHVLNLKTYGGQVGLAK